MLKKSLQAGGLGKILAPKSAASGQNSSGKPDYYLHIGLHKTGSTSIQQTLFANRRLLQRKMGICYLPLQASHGKMFFRLFGDQEETEPEERESRLELRKRPSLQKLRTTLEGAKERKVVISGEQLSLLKEEGVGKLHGFLSQLAGTIKVIVYVRDPVRVASSWAQQLLKSGKGTLEEFERNPPVPEFKARIQPYIQYFGRDNVVIRVFEEAVNQPHGLLGDFLETLGENPVSAGKLEQKRTNESLCREATLILNEVQKARPLLVDGRFNEGRMPHDANQIFRQIPGETFILSQESLKRAAEVSASDVTWLAEQIGRNPYARSSPAVAPAEQGSSSWRPDTLKELGLRIFDLYAEVGELRAEVMLSEAREAIAEKKPGRAAKILEKALRKNPKSKKARNLLKEVQTKLGMEVREGKGRRGKRKQKSSE